VQLHEEGDDSCSSPSSLWGCVTVPCFIFLTALQHCSAFFSFFLLLRYRVAVTFLYGGDLFFFALLLLML